MIKVLFSESKEWEPDTVHKGRKQVINVSYMEIEGGQGVGRWGQAGTGRRPLVTLLTVRVHACAFVPGAKEDGISGMLMGPFLISYVTCIIYVIRKETIISVRKFLKMYIKLVRNYLIKISQITSSHSHVDITFKILTFFLGILKTKRPFLYLSWKFFFIQRFTESLNTKEIYNHTMVKMLNRQKSVQKLSICNL